LSDRAATLSDLELRYPFAPRSREFFESIPMDERLASAEVVKQTEERLMSALGRKRYEPHLSELIEFSSFFAAALVASQDGFMVSKYAASEGGRAKRFFVSEAPRSKAATMEGCFGITAEVLADAGRESRYSMDFQDFLSLVAKYELAKQPKWKLARQALQEGKVFMTDNLLNDFFGDCAQQAVAAGARNLRRAVFPKQLAEVRNAVMRYVPAPRTPQRKGYSYVDGLLEHPVSDGRHRLVWMVLAPYLVNVKKLEEAEAIEKIRAFVSVAGETADMRRFVEYNVKRARRNGLLPPTLSTLKSEHPDLYALIPRDALPAEAPVKARTAKESSRR
jgi:non-catalytic primase subunit PriX-like protein